jgi:hypothetical protein
MRLEKLHLDCASSAPAHHGSTQQWPLLHRKDYLQGSEIRAVISQSRLVPIIATSPEPMATARLGQMVTLGPRRLAEQPLRSVAASLAAARPGGGGPRPPRRRRRPGRLNLRLSAGPLHCPQLHSWQSTCTSSCGPASARHGCTAVPSLQLDDLDCTMTISKSGYKHMTIFHDQIHYLKSDN